MLDFPRVGGKPRRPKALPDDLYADRGDDSEAIRALLRRLGIEPHIPKRRVPHGSGLGQLRLRYVRLGVIEGTLTTLAACVICNRNLHRDLEGKTLVLSGLPTVPDKISEDLTRSGPSGGLSGFPGSGLVADWPD